MPYVCHSYHTITLATFWSLLPPSGHSCIRGPLVFIPTNNPTLISLLTDLVLYPVFSAKMDEDKEVAAIWAEVGGGGRGGRGGAVGS